MGNMAWWVHCGRGGARKIQIIISWLGTGQVVKFFGTFHQIRVVESSGDWEGREAFNTPRITNSTDALQGDVPRLTRHEDFGRILDGVNSSSAESVHANEWSKRQQGRRGPYMATPADRFDKTEQKPTRTVFDLEREFLENGGNAEIRKIRNNKPKMHKTRISQRSRQMWKPFFECREIWFVSPECEHERTLFYNCLGLS